MNIKNEVLYRVYFVLILVVGFAIMIGVQTIKVSIVEGAYWANKGDSLYIGYQPVDAPRGNVLAEDGSLLATSMPFFNIHFDPMTVEDEVFDQYVDTLAHCIATLVDPSYTVGGYAQYLKTMRDSNKQYVPIKKNATYVEKELISGFPIFKLGRYKGGLIIETKQKRMKPFRQLAHRTIGYSRKEIAKVGVEGSLDDILKGEEGRQLMFKASGNVWIPVNNYAAVEPKRGNDVVTTLDMNIQEIAHNALMRGLNHHDAHHGTAIVMEVETGAVRAIANLGRTENGWFEIYNYGIGEAVEPGSTFKLASVMSLLEDGILDLNDTIPLFQGKMEFYEEEMVDAVYHELDSASLKDAFAISSNVGIANIIQQNYGENGKAKKFIENLKSFGLNLPTGIELKGEANPYLKEAYSQDDKWSGVTLPWMSTGYEVSLTPLQLLAFYNAVANDGKLVKPYLISEVRQFGSTLEKTRPTIIKRRIASEETIKKARFLLETVVKEGTAKELKTKTFNFAGKTGTAQINYDNENQYLRYRASFVGYFPAERPKYSCIVVVTAPKQNGRYGSEVAGPIFREIADKCYRANLESHPPLNQRERVVLTSNKLPSSGVGLKSEMEFLSQRLSLPVSMETNMSFATLQIEQDTLKILGRSFRPNQVPNVVGMGLRDALFLLENMGLRVKVVGSGKVYRQSIIPGTEIREQEIIIYLG